MHIGYLYTDLFHLLQVGHFGRCALLPVDLDIRTHDLPATAFPVDDQRERDLPVDTSFQTVMDVPLEGQLFIDLLRQPGRDGQVGPGRIVERQVEPGDLFEDVHDPVGRSGR